MILWTNILPSGNILSMDETWKWMKNAKGGNFFKHWNGCKGSMGESCIVVINFVMHIHQSIWPRKFKSIVKWKYFNIWDMCLCNISCPSS